MESVEWVRKAAEQEIAAAQNRLGVCCSEGIGMEADEVQAVGWFRKAAEQGLAAIFGLAWEMALSSVLLPAFG